VNQNYGTTGIKHAVAMLLMMALADENHQHLNIDYVSSRSTPLEVSTAAEAKWLRDLILVVDPKIYEQVRQLINGGLAVPGGVVDRQLFQDTAANISLILRGLGGELSRPVRRYRRRRLDAVGSDLFPAPLHLENARSSRRVAGLGPRSV